MQNKQYSLQYNKLLSTDLIKAVAIILIILNHTINYKIIDTSVVNRQYYLLFWVYQAVSLFVVITGIHYSKSMDNLIYNYCDVNSSWEERVIFWYKRNNFLKKIKRIWIPYTIEQLTWFVYCRCIRGNINIKDIFFKYMSGGVGPGGYYTVCMIQIIVIFPVLYYVIKNIISWELYF